MRIGFIPVKNSMYLASYKLLAAKTLELLGLVLLLWFSVLFILFKLKKQFCTGIICYFDQYFLVMYFIIDYVFFCGELKKKECLSPLKPSPSTTNTS